MTVYKVRPIKSCIQMHWSTASVLCCREEIVKPTLAEHTEMKFIRCVFPDSTPKGISKFYNFRQLRFLYSKDRVGNEHASHFEIWTPWCHLPRFLWVRRVNRPIWSYGRNRCEQKIQVLPIDLQEWHSPFINLMMYTGSNHVSVLTLGLNSSGLP